MSVIHNDLLLSTDEATGYNLTNSLRFRRSASAYLSRSQTSGNSKTWTWSGWVKRGSLSSTQTVFGTLQYPTPSNYQTYIYFTNTDNLEFFAYTGSTTNAQITTTQVFRDVSAWYYITLVVDTTQATSSNRVKLYVNGSLVTSLTNATYPSQNYDTWINNSGSSGVGLGRTYPYNDTQYFDGYMAEINFIDGQALTPSSFGEFNADTGVWQPKRYTGTYGTNGFYLQFTDVATTSGSNAGLGKDFSGNGNYWTTNNISVTAGSTYDSMTDVPTLTSETAANYCVVNPLGAGVSTSNGNLTVNTGNVVSNGTIQIPNTGKWYWEFSPSDANGLQSYCGVGNSTGSLHCAYYGYDGYKYIDGTGSAYGSAYGNGDLIGVYVDADAGEVRFYKNNVAQNTITYSIANKNLFPYFADGTGSYGVSINVNFGQRPFSYTPPTGALALNTYNLPDSTIVAGNTVMDATTYTGNGSTQTITNAGGFKPDLVWLKRRDGSASNILVDSVRGLSYALSSDQTSSETANAFSYLSSLNSDGFSLSTNTSGDYWYVNVSGQTYVGWQWQAGQGTTSSNTDGSITSTVSVNATAGFSVVSYTTGNGTVGHGLGVAPKFFITKDRGSVGNWHCWHTGLSSTTNAVILLNTTGAQLTAFNYWASAPTSTTFGDGSNIYGTGKNIIAYCWSEIAGFSKFGSYTGNGSSDGPFVYTGFRPKFVMFKRIDSTVGWGIIDSSRNTYNFANELLEPNTSGASQAYSDLGFDFVSNGLKVRGASGNTNASGGTYIYAAFAENPFKNSLAR